MPIYAGLYYAVYADGDAAATGALRYSEERVITRGGYEDVFRCYMPGEHTMTHEPLFLSYTPLSRWRQ